MKPGKAIAILTVPFAIIWMASMTGMCLTSYWHCKLEQPLDIHVWKPLLFLFLLFSTISAIVLLIDFFLIQNALPQIKQSRLIALLLGGSLVATFPHVLWKASGGQGVGAMVPQVDYFPSAMVGAVFALLLDRIIRYK